MEQNKKVYQMDWAGRPLIVEVGQLAKQAGGSALVRYGDSVVLSTATGSKEPKQADFFPLTVMYEEKMYAVGKVPGGFIRREGRPSERATLASRLIDRPLRPLFAEGFRNEISVNNMVLSVEQDCSTEMAAMFGSSLSLCISNIPFNGPIAGVVVGRVNGEFVINPTVEQMEQSDINLTVAGTKDGINMVEAGAKEVPEMIMLDAIMFGHKEIKKLVAFQEEIVREVGQAKVGVVLFELDKDLLKEIHDMCYAQLKAAVSVEEKHARQDAIEAVDNSVIDVFVAREADAITMKQVKEILHKMMSDEVRRLITEDKVRPDGRKVDEIRPLASEVGILPRTHGTGLFTRGQTQVLSVCTLGAMGDQQKIDGLGLEETKRFMHHYNFPSFSVGEVRPSRGPGRREIGHGALGERALEPIIPNDKDFPYTIRIVSEVLESNGSSSQASICGSTLALMDAGVPIKAPVSGIAMGLVKDGDNYTILSDIQGLEDHYGDMDFKVAGTPAGVTALQMDIKIEGLTEDILKEALQQAEKGRAHILEHMMTTMNKPRTELSKYAPKIEVMMINPDKIRDVIGPGGKQINKIIDETGVKIDIEQDGTVFIASQDAEMIAKAKSIIESLTREAEVGALYMGKVISIKEFGCFIEIFPGKEGMCHISELALERVKKVEDVVKEGEEFLVKVVKIDPTNGKISLSRKEVLKQQSETVTN